MTRVGLIFLMLGLGVAMAQNKKVITVNGVPLSAAVIEQLEYAYQTRLVSGHFWYDPFSGLWGMWGGPSLGQMVAGLKLGGPLPKNASGGKTKVFVNGRALHSTELAYLKRIFGHIQPGRYWLNASGIGGFEGQRASFNLNAGNLSAGGRDWIRRTPGGTIGGDGNCFYYNDPETGSSVMGGPGC